MKHIATFSFFFLFGHYGGKKKRQEGRPIMTLKIWKKWHSIGSIFLGADHHSIFVCSAVGSKGKRGPNDGS